ncbi:MAG: response regulator [Pseudomonadota bacterium]
MKRCVVVEEAGLVRDVTCAVLDELTFKTVGVDNAQKALELIDQAAIDLVLLDWDLPDLGALDVLTGLASMPDETRPRVLIMATACDPKQLRLAREAGVADCLSKPLDTGALRQIVEDLPLPSSERAA